MPLYAGIDLHSNNSVLVVLDEQDRMVYKKRLANDLNLILQELLPYREELRGVVVESTYNWYWLVDGLMEAGYTVHLANTAASHQYAGLKHADDNSDARWLAHMLRLGILKEGYIYPKEERPIRDLLRKRSQLVGQKTAQMLSIENLYARNTGTQIKSNQVRKMTEIDVDQEVPDIHLNMAIKGNLAVFKCLQEQVDKIEKEVLKYIRADASFVNLKTTPGIGDILAMTIRLEVGDIKRFADVGNFASYSRCVGSIHTSNGKKKGEGNRKNGNKYLAWAFMEAANFAVRFDEQIRRYYQRKKARTNGIVAIKTIAHKIARACYYILRDDVPFDVSKAFG